MEESFPQGSAWELVSQYHMIIREKIQVTYRLNRVYLMYQEYMYRHVYVTTIHEKEEAINWKLESKERYVEVSGDYLITLYSEK